MNYKWDLFRTSMKMLFFFPLLERKRGRNLDDSDPTASSREFSMDYLTFQLGFLGVSSSPSLQKEEKTVTSILHFPFGAERQ